MFSKFIIPKDSLTQVIWRQYCHQESIIETCHFLTKLNEPKKWLMSGNPMTLDACIEKCKRWSRRFSLTYDILNAGTKFQVSMSRLSFVYDWELHEAILVTEEEATRAIGWSQNKYVLNGKHCCNLDKLFTINERLEYALELRDLIEWSVDNGIYEKKKNELKNLIVQLEWWKNTLQIYSFHELKLASKKHLSMRGTVDGKISIKSFMGHGWLDRFIYNSCSPKSLDKFYAERFLPEIKSRLSKLEEMQKYLSCIRENIPSYPLYSRPMGFCLYKDYRKKIYKRDLTEDMQSVYNILYDAALHLSHRNSEYNQSHLAYFQMSLPDKNCPQLQIYIWIGNKYMSHDKMFNLTCLPEEIAEKFPPFYKKFVEQAQICANNIKVILKQKILMINNRLSEQ